MANFTRKTTVKATQVVQIALLPEHAEDIEHCVLKFSDTFNRVLELTKEGYNLTIAYDTEREKYSVRLAGVESQCVNAGKLLYGNGKDVVYAFASVFVKHFLVCKGLNWETSVTQTSDYS